MVNADGQGRKVEVVVFEGWCVGFRALSEEALERKWRKAREAAESPGYDGQLGKLEFESVSFVNVALREYDALTE